eukprot:TRINITY_DN3275_c0_g1_i1.p1 TRINITY_DN3275_c0_g1~~TRINITY_DN3275_c0_g1_i1.p1  ORF type:complete len:182 (-),score=34.73 TRINITY_DN3275_c0_g1_i1:153-698(-)
MEITIRNLTREDIQHVVFIQNCSYPKALQEDENIFSSMLQSFPQGCFLILCDHQPAGYAFSFPYFQRKSKDLHNGCTLSLTGKEDCLYLHDMAVHQNFRGKRLADMLLEKVESLALSLKLNVITLTAVIGAESFWKKKDFVTLYKLNYSDPQKLDSFMQKSLVISEHHKEPQIFLNNHKNR